MPICDLDSPWWMLSDYSDTQVRFYARTQAAVNIFWPFASTLRCPSAWETDSREVREPETASPGRRGDRYLIIRAPRPGAAAG